jgi:arylsulfatase A-like enzyme
MTGLKPLLAIAAAASLGGAVLAPLTSSIRRPAPLLNVLLITLDTTRADRLSPYGLMDGAMPHLDRLAREGVVFDRAYTVAPLTLPAHASVMTGLLPPSHGVRDNADAALAPAHTTLAEVLRSRGFRTGAFVGSTVLAGDRGLAQGFDVYRWGEADGSHERRADVVVGEALSWLEVNADSSFFLWTHLNDPHLPYDPPEPFRSARIDRYVGEIMFVDTQIGRLLDLLDRRRLTGRTVVIVAADHGEGLGEHGEATHGLFVYDAVLRVPLIVRTPGISRRRVEGLASLTDLFPTVLELLRLPTLPSDGRSLTGVMKGTDRMTRELYAESLYGLRFGMAPARSVRDERYKFISGGELELYDVARDPFETSNIVRERANAAAAMRARVDAISGRLPTSRDLAARGVAKEVRERLAALGYLGHAPTSR